MFIAGKTLEDLEKEYADKPQDESWFHQQAVLGTEEDKQSAYDEEGNFHCINWFDCSYCPAFNATHCL